MPIGAVLLIAVLAWIIDRNKLWKLTIQLSAVAFTAIGATIEFVGLLCLVGILH
jgi:hypothetical protein